MVMAQKIDCYNKKLNTTAQRKDKTNDHPQPSIVYISLRWCYSDILPEVGIWVYVSLREVLAYVVSCRSVFGREDGSCRTDSNGTSNLCRSFPNDLGEVAVSLKMGLIKWV